MSPRLYSLRFAAALFLGSSFLAAHADSEVWSSTSSGNWSDGSKWTNSSAPGSTSSTTNTDTATFGGGIGVNVTVDQTGQNIGSMLFTGTSNSGCTFNGDPLLLSSGGSIVNAVLAQNTQTFYSPLVIEPVNFTSNGTYTFTDPSQYELGNFVFDGRVVRGCAN